jgi:hypothetical protein
VRRLAKASSAGPTSGSARARGVIILAIVVLCSLVFSSLAQANDVTNFFGANGSGDGQFEGPGAVAVNEGGAGGVPAGSVYVIDSFHNRVERFSASGAFADSFGEAGSGDGQFEFGGQSAGIAVDQSDGSVYVVDIANNRVQKFEADGDFVKAIGTFSFSGQNAGVAVQPAAPHDIYVTDTGANQIQRFDSSGAFKEAWGEFGETPGSTPAQFISPTRIGIDSAGRVYVLDFGPAFTGQVQRFSATGTFEQQIGAAELNVFANQLAVDPSGHSYVANFNPSFTEMSVLEFDSAGALVETHGQGSKGTLNSSGGVAVNSTTSDLYFSIFNSARVAILANVPDPTATIAAVDNETATSASFHGSVDPKGALSSFHFEYVDDAQFQVDGFASATVLPETEAAPSPGPVSRAVAGLDPSTLYHVRLVASHTYGIAKGVSGATTFTTDPAGPIVAPVAHAEAQTTSATLVGRVTANGQATSYRFEWGPSASYGNSTPAPNGSAGSGTDSVPVAATLSGLAPNTTYHFRLLATNGSGTATGADHSFVTDAPLPASCPNSQFRVGAGANLPDCRAYEQVSPTDKNGNDVDITSNADAGGPVAADGSATAFPALGSFAGMKWGGLFQSYYLSRRDPNGWSTSALLPPAFSPKETNGLSEFPSAFSPDLTQSIISSPAALTSESASTNNFYLQDNVTGALELAAASPSQTDGFAATANLDQFVFQTGATLTTDPNQPAGVQKAYAVTPDGIELVSRQPGTDEPFQDEAVLGGIQSTAGVLSDDGSYAFFSTNNAGVKEVYRRTLGGSTELVSPSKRTPADPGGPESKQFLMASRDGSRVFFTSTERLTDDANENGEFSKGDLYRYDVETDELVDLSARTPGATPADAQGVLGIDDDGDRVYFAALGQMTIPGVGVTGEIGKANLYFWEDDGTPAGTLRFIAALDNASPLGNLHANPFDADNWSRAPSEEVFLTSKVMADGSGLAFNSRENLTAYDQAGQSQAYLYRADADGGAGSLTCVSCGPGSGPAAGPSKAALARAAAGRLDVGHQPRAISSDGERLLFNTPNPLVPGDTNAKNDAYLWHAEGADGCAQAGGCVDLISSGTGDSAYGFAMSASGDDAFFRTRDQLVPADGDTLFDLYTAHVGGGFASQFDAGPPSCAGEECRNEGSKPPAIPSPLTSSFAGAGNSGQAPKSNRCAKGKRKVRAKNGKSRCAAKKPKRSRGKKRTASKSREASR